MPAAPPASAGPEPDASATMAADSGEGRSEGHQELVITFCCAVLQEPGRAAVVAKEALVDGPAHASGDSPPDPEWRSSPVEALGAAWRACLVQESRSSEDRDRRSGGGGDSERVQPGGAAYRSPDLGDEVRVAARALDPVERAALVLGGWSEVSPGEIADVLGLADDAEADRLVGRARLALSAQLRGEGRPLLDDDPAECSRALALMVRRRDVGLGRREDRDWLDAHLAACSRCAERRLVMGEAALAWRAWTPAEPAAAVSDAAGRPPPLPSLAHPPKLTRERRREIGRRAGAALVGAALIGGGAIFLAPGSGESGSGGPRPRPRLAPRAKARGPHHGRFGFTSAPVRLPPAQPQR